MASSARAFLTAEWRDIAMLNYRVAPELLAPYVPAGTELDHWGSHTYVSLVGFRFARTRLLGAVVPWHRNFEEVNLRFYVRREHAGGTRRAVVFIRELVPRRAIALVARCAYNEPYLAVPMQHRLGEIDPETGAPCNVEYSWAIGGRAMGMCVEPTGQPTMPGTGSEIEFITEHYWGYTRQRDGGTIEYRVEHPQWRVWVARSARVDGPVASLYGSALGDVLTRAPDSAFLAEGSAVTVFAPTRLPD